MKLVAGTALLVMVTSCALFRDGSDDSQVIPDAHDNTEVCAQARSEWRDVVASIDRACTRPEDCVAVGGVDTCDCTVPLSAGCVGDPVSRSGLAAVSNRLDAITSSWVIFACRSIVDLGVVCDCAPATATCVNNRCVDDASSSCFPADAGVVDR
jgi:hypothetical protein